MIERSYTTPDGCKITAYLERDACDWDTCVVLEFDQCRITMTWTDYDPEGRPIKAVEDYLIDSVDVEWNGELLADRSSDLFDAEPLLSLSELPEVLRVVQVALEAWNASERLTAAAEALGGKMKQKQWVVSWTNPHTPLLNHLRRRAIFPTFTLACWFARELYRGGCPKIHLAVHHE